MTVVGDVDEAETLELIKKEFGRHERSPQPIPDMYTTEPPQEGQRRAIVSRPHDVNVVGLAYKMPEALHADMPALALASIILGEGKTSRLYRELVDTALCADVTMAVFPFRDPSLFIAYATLAGRATHDDVEARMQAAYRKLAKAPPSAAEMTQAKQLYRAALAARRDGPGALLASLNEDIARGDWTLFTTFPDAIGKVTARDVSRVVAKYLTDESQSTICWFVGGSKPVKAAIASRRPATRKPKKRAAKKAYRVTAKARRPKARSRRKK